MTVRVRRGVGKLLAALVVSAAPDVAQVRIDASRLPGGDGAFERRPGEKKFACEVRPFQATMGFSFRFQAGYAVRVPMKDYLGRNTRFRELVRVTPEGGQAAYLIAGARLRAIKDPKAAVEFGGAFLVGEGRYAVDLAMFDAEGGVCRKSWRIQARLSGSERSMKQSLAQGEVAAMGWPRPVARPGTEAAPPHLTVLLHAAPIASRQLTLRPYDRFMLAALLASLLDQAPAQTTRLVVFNLDQQQEIFREDHFEPAAIQQMSEALSRIELGQVNYQTLKNRRGHLRLLADLIGRELKTASPGDVVVFLGPPSRYSDRLPESALEGGPGGARFFDFQCWTSRSRGREFPYTIEHAVAKLGGRTVRIHNASEFAKAIGQLTAAAGAAAR